MLFSTSGTTGSRIRTSALRNARLLARTAKDPGIVLNVRQLDRASELVSDEESFPLLLCVPDRNHTPTRQQRGAVGLPYLSQSLQKEPSKEPFNFWKWSRMKCFICGGKGHIPNGCGGRICWNCYRELMHNLLLR